MLNCYILLKQFRQDRVFLNVSHVVLLISDKRIFRPKSGNQQKAASKTLTALSPLSPSLPSPVWLAPNVNNILYQQHQQQPKFTHSTTEANNSAAFVAVVSIVVASFNELVLVATGARDTPNVPRPPATSAPSRGSPNSGLEVSCSLASNAIYIWSLRHRGCLLLLLDAVICGIAINFWLLSLCTCVCVLVSGAGKGEGQGVHTKKMASVATRICMICTVLKEYHLMFIWEFS